MPGFPAASAPRRTLARPAGRQLLPPCLRQAIRRAAGLSLKMQAGNPADVKVIGGRQGRLRRRGSAGRREAVRRAGQFRNHVQRLQRCFARTQRPDRAADGNARTARKRHVDAERSEARRRRIPLAPNCARKFVPATRVPSRRWPSAQGACRWLPRIASNCSPCWQQTLIPTGNRRPRAECPADAASRVLCCCLRARRCGRASLRILHR